MQQALSKGLGTRQPAAGAPWDQPASHVRVLAVTFHNTHSCLIIKVHLFYASVGALLWEWVPGYTATRPQQTDRKRGWPCPSEHLENTEKSTRIH